MARNLVSSGHQVTVYNRTRRKAETLTAAGARVADSPADACRGAEAVVTMLADDRAVEQVVLSENGIAASLPSRAIHVSCSTIGIALAKRLDAEHSRRGQGFVSAPVFGRPDAAENKSLLVVAAGSEAMTERCQPLFDAIGRRTFVLVSEPWEANAVKLTGNFMIASMIAAFGESFEMLRKAGVEPEAFLEVVGALFGSPMYANYGRLIAEERFEPAGFALRLGLKDMRLMLDMAEGCGAQTPLASLIRDQLAVAMERGQGDKDWASFSRVAGRRAGKE